MQEKTGKQDYAEELFRSGCNCSQAVLMAFHKELGLERDLALRLAAPFGGGMGRMREVCGAMTGLFMVAGIKYGYTDLNDKEAKARHYQLVQEFAARFREQFGSILCRDLLITEGQDTVPVPQERTAAYYERRPCVEYVRFAAGLLEEYDKQP